MEKLWALSLTKSLNRGESFLAMAEAFCDTRVLFTLFFSGTGLLKNLHVKLNMDTYSCQLRQRIKHRTPEKEEYKRKLFCSTEELMVGTLQMQSSTIEEVLDLTWKEQWCHEQEYGQDEPQRSLPTSTVLRYQVSSESNNWTEKIISKFASHLLWLWKPSSTTLNLPWQKNNYSWHTESFQKVAG